MSRRKSVPSYRRHSSGQARVTINGRDYLLGPCDSPESHEQYGKLIAEWSGSDAKSVFGLPRKASIAEPDFTWAHHQLASSCRTDTRCLTERILADAASY